jgi:hypothetical protein
MFFQREEQFVQLEQLGDTTAAVGMWTKPIVRRKTKIVCTIGPSTNTKEMIWKLAEAGMNVARMNMSHGDHASHQKVIDLVKEYNAQAKDNVIAIMLDTKVGLLHFDAISGCLSCKVLMKCNAPNVWRPLETSFMHKLRKKKT